MVTSNNVRRAGLTVAVLALALMVAMPAIGQIQNPVANTHLDGTTIFWEPLVDHERVVVRVSGPNGVISQVFEAGKTPFFDLLAQEGEIDGEYTFELMAVPVISAQAKDQLRQARAADDLGVARRLQANGTVPSGPVTMSGYFRVANGLLVNDSAAEEAGPRLQPNAGDVGTSSGASVSNISAADQVIADDLIVQSSACVGSDCVNGESFGFDTLRLKENNLRIKFQDTSNSGSFPTNDWQLTANESDNGGANKFSIDDIDGGRTPFTIEAGAPSNSLYVDDGGRVGLGTSTPVVELHVVNGDSPALRLEQNGSSGFQSQTWDVAGNETNFFVRDATNGSKIPFKIRPNADTNSLVIEANGDVTMSGGNMGIGTTSPSGVLHIENTAGDDADDALFNSDGQLAIGSTNPGGLPTMMKLANPDAATGAGAVRFVLENASGNQWSFTNDNLAAGELEINYIPNAGTEFVIDGNGDVTATSFNPTSSRALKNNLRPIEPKEILAKLSALPISTWSFIWEDGTRHLGPMAEEFKAAFGLGDSDKRINLTDAAGVAFAAIQGLQLRVEEKDQEIAQLKERVATTDDLAARVAQLEAALLELVSEK